MRLVSGMTTGRIVRLCGYGRDRQAAARGGYDRPSGAERVGRGAGRRRDYHAVAVVGGYHLSVDVCLDRCHRGAAALYRYLVQRIERRASAAAARGREHRARFGAQLRAGYAGEKVVYRIAVVFGQKAEPAAVDAGHGRGAVFEAVYAVEQRAVAAVADHHIAVRRPMSRVYPAGVDDDAGRVARRLGKLLIYRVVEAVAVECGEYVGDLRCHVRRVAARKKYDIHLAKRKKYLTLQGKYTKVLVSPRREISESELIRILSGR